MSQVISEFVSAPSFEVMLIVGRAVALVFGFLLLAWALSAWRRNAQRDTQRVFEQLDLVRSELLIMKEVMHDAAQRVDRTSNTVRMPQPVVNSGGGAVRGYEIAARMARNGAGKDELIRSCGITPHEAELLIKLHSREVRVPATATTAVTGNQAAAKSANKLDVGAVSGAIGRQPRSPAKQEPLRTPVHAAAQRPAAKMHSRLVAVG